MFTINIIGLIFSLCFSISQGLEITEPNFQQEQREMLSENFGDLILPPSFLVPPDGSGETSDWSEIENLDSVVSETRDLSVSETRDSTKSEMQDPTKSKKQVSAKSKTRASTQSETQDPIKYKIRDSSESETWDSSKHKTRGSSTPDTRDSTMHKSQDSTKFEIQDLPVSETQGLPTPKTGNLPVSETGEFAVSETGEISVSETGELAVSETRNLPVSETGDLPVSETGDLPVSETGELAVSETRDLYEYPHQLLLKIGGQHAGEDGLNNTLSRLKTLSRTKQNSDGKCQDASDCASNQICYLPTNECKNQLTLSLTQRSSCSRSADCMKNEVCYSPSKTCVCDVNSIEISGECVHLSTLRCDSRNRKKHTDSAGWTITPYCTATAKHPNLGLIDLGTYSSGSGMPNDPMMYLNGSSISCYTDRRTLVEYLCYCEEYSCTKEPSWDTVQLFWGEFDPCVYSLYIFTPLVCTDRIA